MISLRSFAFIKLITIGVIGTSLLLAYAIFGAAPARAAGLTDTQIQSVLGLLSSFNVSADTVTQVSNVLYGRPSTAPSGQGFQGQGSAGGGMGSGGPAAWTCGSSTVPAGTLQRGAHGPEVSHLQSFLSSHFGVASSTLVTGFFGPMTQNYLQQFQQEQGLPSTGFFGSLTSAAISRPCSGKGFVPGTFGSTTPWQSGTGSASPSSWKLFYASPTWGSAPLNVSFSLSWIQGTTSYAIDFGDGQNSGQLSGVCRAVATTTASGLSINTTVCSVAAPHTYAATGTYSAKLLSCDTGGVCSAPVLSVTPVIIRVTQGYGTYQASSTPPTSSGVDRSGTTGTTTRSGGAANTFR